MARRLVAMGWSCRVVTLDQDRIGSTRQQYLHVSRLRANRNDSSRIGRALSSLRLGLRSAVTVIRARPSAVHVHGIFWWTIPPVVAGRLVRSTVVIKATRDGDDDPRTVMAKRIGRFRVGAVYGLSLRLAHVIVVLNGESMQSCRGLPCFEKVRQLPNGIEVNELRRTELRRATARQKFGVPADGFVITFVGFLAPHKGVGDLITAWEQWRSKESTQLWLVGPDSGFYRELSDDVVADARALAGRDSRVQLLGHKPPDELPEIFWATDLYVLPSYAEGMPNSLLEALGAGCQILATDIPGIIDIVDEQSAFLVRPGDVVGLVENMRQAEAGVEKATHNIVAKIDIHHLAEIYDALYRRVEPSAKREVS
ncbi:glycosyltransferase family 4 protein [Nocardioides sp. KIGAM211]|uniref:Glycosyltransferase family 4 protein n=1 Tax=Nocardioides luti TaxID=2761101 RepID=A0A7X0VB64_9ACTN|nr:glycosyltransferase family 4 protein [Nocardioides luti]